MPVQTTTSTIYALNVSLVGITGTFLGMPAEALILGAAGGAISLARGEPTTRGKAVSTIIASMLLAGTASPAVVAWLVKYIELADPEEELLYFKSLAPFVIGACWQWAIPFLAAKAEQTLQSLFKQKQDGDQS